MQYRANGEAEISALFNQEGDALRRSGFNEPDMSRMPAGFNPNDTGFSTAREAARLGIDLEQALEG